MMTEKDLTKISKLLSLVLRHQPDAIGIKLDENGWTDVKILLDKINKSGTKLDFKTLEHVVENNNKKRFSFNKEFDKIRANQGHSVDVELGLTPVEPPEILYHGTGIQSVDSILKLGLEKKSRNHVHLSKDVETAILVGKRHGKPVVLEIMTGEMFNQNYLFYLSDNFVWLTESVPAQFIRILK